METATQKPLNVLGALPSNKFTALFKEGLRGEALNDAIYTLTMQDKETWDDFTPKSPPPRPVEPMGFDEAYSNYKTLKNKSAKVEAWKEIKDKWGFYIDSVHATLATNKADLHFLGEMNAHFKKRGMTTYETMTRKKMDDYAETISERSKKEIVETLQSLYSS